MQSTKYNQMGFARREGIRSIPFTIRVSSLVTATTCPSPRSYQRGEEFESLANAKGSSCLLRGFSASRKGDELDGKMGNGEETRWTSINSHAT